MQLNIPITSTVLLCSTVVFAQSPPANDYCQDASEMYLGTTAFTTIDATTDGDIHPECDYDGQTYNDIWYTFTSGADGTLVVSTCNDVDYDSDLVVYLGDDCADLELLGCNDDFTGCSNWSSYLEVPVYFGERIIIRVGSYGQYSPSGSGIITLDIIDEDGNSVPSPANDDYANAVPISGGDTYFTTFGATTGGVNHPKCDTVGDGGVTAHDIWYRYIAPTNGTLTLSTCDQANYDTDLVLYEDIGNTLSFVACNDDGVGCSGYSSEIVATVNAGSEYVFRVGGWSYGEYGAGILSAELDGDAVHWIGGVSSSWFDAGNWDSGVVPTAAVDVIIDDSVNIDQSDAEANSITIQSNGHLQVGTGSSTIGSLDSTSITVQSGGTLQLQNSGSSITATDILIESGGGLNWFGGTINILGGTLESTSNISMGLYDTCTLHADFGVIDAATFTIGELGSMHGTSWSYVDSLVNHGTIYVDGSYNYTKIYGDYTQYSTGTLVTNFTSDTSYTWLIVDNNSSIPGSGISTIEGTLRLVSNGGYIPTDNTVFDAVKSYEGLHTGTFDTIELIDFSGGITFAQSEDSGGVTVTSNVIPIHYVDADNTSGDGSSWATAYTTVQEALAVASLGEQIWIAEGTYTPGNLRTDTFSIPYYVGCYGGFEGTETSADQRDIAAHPTILSGDIGSANDDSDNVYHVVTVPSESIAYLDGITITQGNANGTGTQENGAGIYQSNSSFFLLNNCTLIDNNASGLGGGIYTTVGYTSFSNCTVDHNKAVRGGGIYANDTEVSIEGTNIINNRANTFDWVVGVYGGGLYIEDGSLEITNSLFTGNSADYGVGLISQGTGGAIYAETCDTVIGKTSFDQNGAINGGAIFFYDISFNQIALIHHCSFERNYIHYNMNWTGTGAAALQQQGSACVTNVVNCLFAGNDGEGESIIDMGTTGGYLNRITNCTIAHNVDLDTSPAVAGSAKIENSIVWHNEGTYGRDSFQQINGAFLIDTCLVDGFDTYGATSGEDPLFVSPRGPDGIYRTGDEDYHLLPNSPIIDWGDDGLFNYPVASVPLEDFDGKDRFVNDPYSYDWDPPSTIDLGCYEYQMQYSGVPGYRSWNYEGDGWVDFDNDLNWNPNEAPTANDTVVVATRCAHTAYVSFNQDTTLKRLLMPQGFLNYYLNNYTLTLSESEDAFLLGHHDVTDFAYLTLLNGTLVTNRIDIAGGENSSAVLGINSGMTLQLSDGLVLREGGDLFGGGTVQGNVFNSGKIESDAMHNNYPIIVGDYSMVDGAIVGLDGSGTFKHSLEPIDYDPGNGYDKLVISGSATLGGTLYLSGASNSPVIPGQTITLLEADGGINGTFDSVWAMYFDEDIVPLVSYVNNVSGSGQSVVVTMQSISGLTGFGDPDATGITGLPEDGELADINDDGFPDLILSVPSDIPSATGNILILYNNGIDAMGDWLGFSSTVQQIPVGVRPSGIAIGDMDNDGDMDIAVANTADNTIDILINDAVSRGSVSFSTLDPPIDASYFDPGVDVEPTDVALGQFSADGLLDIAIANNGNSTMVIFQGPLTVPSFMPVGSDTPLSGGSTTINPGDVTTDKDFSINVTGGGGKSSVVKGSPTLRGIDITTIIELDMGSSVSEQLVVDLDSNGVPTADRRDDLVTADPVANAINIVLQKADGTYGTPMHLPLAGYENPQSLSAIDMDNDGDLDIAVVALHIVSGNVVTKMFRNDSPSGGGTVVLTDIQHDEGAALNPLLARSGDLNGDGIDDLLMVTDTVTTYRTNDPTIVGSTQTVLNEYTVPSCDGDIDENGTVDVADILILIADWGSGTGPSDLNSDGTVDVADILILIAAWGECP